MLGPQSHPGTEAPRLGASLLVQGSVAGAYWDRVLGVQVLAVTEVAVLGVSPRSSSPVGFLLHRSLDHSHSGEHPLPHREVSGGGRADSTFLQAPHVDVRVFVFALFLVLYVCR